LATISITRWGLFELFPQVPIHDKVVVTIVPTPSVAREALVNATTPDGHVLGNPGAAWELFTILLEIITTK
jgi:hypothetical protein